MAIFGAVIILKLGLDQYSFVTDLFSNGGKDCQYSSFLIIGEIRRRFSTLNDSIGVCSISEDVIDICAESCVVNEPSREFVFFNESINFLIV